MGRARRRAPLLRAAFSGLQPQAGFWAQPHNHSVGFVKISALRLDDWKTWSRWFEAAGLTDPVAHGPVLNRASMLIDAAVGGQGVALARTALAAWDLINGRLVRPIDVSLRMSNTYWIVCPKATSVLPKITVFREWLLAETADDMRRLKALNS